MGKYLKPFIIENSELMAEWDWKTNNEHGLFPDKITCGSDKSVCWLCKDCHMSYHARIPDRIGKKTGCPYCAGKKPIPGVNDLETWCKKNGREDLIDEWKPELNDGKLPSEFLFASNKKIIWECSHCGAQYPKQIDQRTLRGVGCRECRITGTSFPEQYLYYGLKTIVGHTQNSYKALGFEVDIFLEEHNIAIEYNGEFFHEFYNREKSDAEKRKRCSENGIHLLTIKESRGENPSDATYGDVISWKYSRNKECLGLLLIKVLDWVNYVANTSYSIAEIDSNIIYQKAHKYTYGVKPDKSLANKYPDIAAEWDHDKNGDITPEKVSYGSHDAFYWKCQQCGYTWESKVNDRTNGHGCYVCAKTKWADILHKRAAERNNFKDWCEKNNRKILVEEWDYASNPTSPEEWGVGSNEIVYWVCQTCGHRYPATINNRVRGSGCKECWNIRKKIMHTNDKPVQSENSLVAWCIRNKREDLLAQWDYDKNEYPPQNYTYGSKKRVFWKCSNGHSWPAEIKSRTTQGNGCKACSIMKKEK